MIYHFVAGTSFRPMVEDQRSPKFDRCNPSQSKKTGSGSHRLTNSNSRNNNNTFLTCRYSFVHILKCSANKRENVNLDIFFKKKFFLYKASLKFVKIFFWNLFVRLFGIFDNFLVSFGINYSNKQFHTLS